MSNYLPTEEQKAMLKADDWNVVDHGGCQHWFKGDSEIVFFEHMPPPALYGFPALVMAQKLGISASEFTVAGEVKGCFIGDFPVPKVFNGKLVRVTIEEIEKACSGARR